MENKVIRKAYEEIADDAERHRNSVKKDIGSVEVNFVRRFESFELDKIKGNRKV